MNYQPRTGTEPLPAHRRWPTWKVLLLITGVVLAAAGGWIALLLYRFYDVPRMAAQVEELARQYRRAGLPWEATDITPRPPVTTEENAAPTLLAAIEEIRVSKFDKYYDDLREQLSAGHVDKVEPRVTMMAKALRLLHEAAAKPSVDFGRDWDLGPNIRFWEYYYLKTASRLLALSIEVNVRQGRYEDALKDITAGRRLATLAGSEPTLISLLVGIAINAIILDAVERSATVRSDHAQFLRSMRQTIARTPFQPDLMNALYGEIYMEVSTIRNLYLFQSNVEPDPAEIMRTGIPHSRTQRAFLAALMKYWLEGKKLCDAYGSDVRGLSKALDDLTKHQSDPLTFSKMMNVILLPAMAPAGDAALRAEAANLVTTALLDALAFRAANGSFPTSIEELQADYVDPFTKRPLLMRLSGDELRIYSTGPDEQDNDGMAPREIPKGKNNSVGWDVVAIYPRK